jgi:hypothetical protein
MANFAECALVTDESGRGVIVAVTSAHMDGVGGGCWWVLTSAQTGRMVHHGLSKGWDGAGAGSALSGMKAGKAAARRWLKKQARHDAGTVA